MSAYRDLEFEWKLHTFSNKEGPMPQFQLDWDVDILEGRIVGDGRDSLLNDLEEIVRTQEDRLVKHTSPDKYGNGMLDRTHLTARYQNWNVFYVDHPATEVLWSFVKAGHDRFLDEYNMVSARASSIQSWANVLRKGENIGEHTHIRGPHDSQMYLSSNFCVTADEDTATVYDLPGYDTRVAEFRNQPGQLTLFPSWIPHWTTSFEKEDSVRITIASDITLDPWYEASYRDGERVLQMIPFTTHPGIQKRSSTENRDWEDIPGVDGTIARLVNYHGDLTEDVVREMKQDGTEFADGVLVPEGVSLDELRAEDADSTEHPDSEPSPSDSHSE